jgi:hypothetical protein
MSGNHERMRAHSNLLWAALLAGTVILLAIALEAAGLIYFAAKEGGLFYAAHRGQPPAMRDRARQPVSVHRFDPYFGFTLEPEISMQGFLADARTRRRLLAGGDADGGLPAWTRMRTNNFGFFSPVDYPVNDPDAVLIGIFGGSAARMLALQAGPRLEGQLTALYGRPVRVLNFARGGFKQPQQAIVLAYFLLVGQRLDLVINLDGFNDVALARLNVQAGIDSSMPSIQHLRGLELLTLGASDPVAMRHLLSLAESKERETALELSLSRARFAAHYMLADLWRQRVQRRRRALEAAPPAAEDPRRRLISIASPLAETGAGSSEADAKLVSEWVRGSQLMALLARWKGAHYLHVLQPNQYASRRSFSDRERRIAFNDASPYREHATALYPVLRERGAALRQGGIEFRDATDVFVGVSEIVYADDCCHFNQRGNDLLADFVVEAVRAARERGWSGGAPSVR